MKAGLRRVGHKGADLIVPGNTLRSFDAAAACGVDMIEFDVLPEPGTGRLILAHDRAAAASTNPPALDKALAYLASEPFEGIELDVDLKLPGYELQVLDALESHRLLDRTLISSHHLASLARIRSVDPSVRLGWSVPRAARDYTRHPLLALPALALIEVMKRAFPARAEAALRRRRCDAIMAHWRLVTPALASAVRRAGGELYVWTVDDVARIQALDALGVTGVITNDPRLFAALA